MQIYICDICGRAHIGKVKPADCPFCGAPQGFMKEVENSHPVINNGIVPNEAEKGFLLETYNLEIKATAIYKCMAGKAHAFEIKAMYDRLADVEAEHALLVTKILNSEAPEILVEICSDEDVENFKATLALEERATDLYLKFAKESVNTDLKILFTGLAQAERGHIELMKRYLG